MCGRARLSSDVSEIKIVFSVPPAQPAPNFAPSWNVAPTDPLPIVRFDAKEGERSLDVMRWGLIPFWAKDIKIRVFTINARRGGRHQAGFPRGLRQRRCLVPLDNFYEWKKDRLGQAALRHRVGWRRDDGDGRIVRDLALAGGRTHPQLHDRHHDPERTLRGAAQPHARGAEASVARLARRVGGRYGAAQGAARAHPANEMTAWPQPQTGTSATGIDQHRAIESSRVAFNCRVEQMTGPR
jgi:SOS response associated peptidase (SRAP)